MHRKAISTQIKMKTGTEMNGHEAIEMAAPTAAEATRTAVLVRLYVLEWMQSLCIRWGALTISFKCWSGCRVSASVGGP